MAKEGYKPTSGMQSAARRAIKLKEQGKAKGAGTAVGWTRAGQLARGETLSLSTVKRMYSYFSRHEVDKKGKDWDNSENPSNGKIMWLAWGGDAGFSWSRKIVNREKNMKKSLEVQEVIEEIKDMLEDAINPIDTVIEIPENTLVKSVDPKPEDEEDEEDEDYESDNEEEDKWNNMEKACWSGYTQRGMKEKNDMYVCVDPAMSACRNVIVSVITARCAKDKCASGAEKAAAKQSELQATASALLAALLEACSSDARFSHLKESPYIKEDRLAYNVITDDMVKNIWCIPGVRLLFDIIDTVTRQKLTVTTSVSALFDTLSLAEHREKIGPPLRALG